MPVVVGFIVIVGSVIGTQLLKRRSRRDGRFTKAQGRSRPLAAIPNHIVGFPRLLRFTMPRTGGTASLGGPSRGHMPCYLVTGSLLVLAKVPLQLSGTNIRPRVAEMRRQA